ncbi:MAG: sulfite exporter TauE/SafE family protein [Oscillospiraceae bacterium]|nr:sulfite exporter TauE/SafE family protein [Oscillospiraceae bacterium]
MSADIVLAIGASFFAAVIGALGMGGGSVLIIYLTAYLGLEQLAAQGINLVFFLPVAAVALVAHHKHGLIKWQVALPCAVVGLAGVYFGQMLAMHVGSELLQKLFGGFLLIIGVREVFAREARKGADDK